MLNNKKITVIFIVFLAVIFFLPNSVLAQPDIYGTNNLGESGLALSTKSLPEIISNIINIFLGLLGIIATSIILYGGFLWMTSKGNEEQVKKAKMLITNAVIGLAIILSAYIISRFILKKGYEAFFGDGGGSGGGYHGGIGLGVGVLESHYPARNATEIPRNTNIYLTFKVPMDVSSLNISLCEGESTVDCLDDTDLPISYDASQQVFEINPYGDGTGPGDYLGDGTGDIRYHMILDGWRTDAGDSAFPLSGFYDWYFTVNNTLDLIPPTVDSVFPPDDGSSYARNSIVQINFSEAVNPMFAVGEYDGTVPDFTNITIKESGATIVGAYMISNQYRTVEFMTNDACGENSCGGTVYCLPPNEIDGLHGTVTTAISDMSGNQLDPEYTWNFQINDIIDLEPPYMTNMDSGVGLSLIDPISATFSKNLSCSSIKTINVWLDGYTGNYWVDVDAGDTVRILHDEFEPLSSYIPTMNSDITDLMQNCWYPCECEDSGGSCDCNTTDACSGNRCCTGADC